MVAHTHTHTQDCTNRHGLHVTHKLHCLHVVLYVQQTYVLLQADPKCHVALHVVRETIMTPLSKPTPGELKRKGTCQSFVHR